MYSKGFNVEGTESEERVIFLSLKLVCDRLNKHILRYHMITPYDHIISCITSCFIVLYVCYSLCHKYHVIQYHSVCHIILSPAATGRSLIRLCYNSG